MMRSSLLALVAVLFAGHSVSAAAASTSVFSISPADPRAITVKAKGDGQADDTAAIQAALDSARAKGAGGIVLLPSGRYRITHSLYLWPAVRLLGVGPTRPVFVLADNTPGFQKGVATMLIFAGGQASPGQHVAFPPPDSVPANSQIADANPGTFYSAVSNVDFEIGAGDPAAAAVRFHAAQHAYLSHIDFHIGSGLAGIYQVANEAEDLHFFGGRYGILTEKPSPAWQFTLIDSSFTGQREAAIREHEAGLTLVNTAIRDTPVGIDIDPGYGDWLWGKDVRLENVSRAGVVISNENNAYTQVGFDNAVAARTPVFARFRDSGKTVAAPGAAYRMRTFSYGLTVPGLGSTGHYAATVQAEAISALPAATSALRALPPMKDWVSVHDLGVKGDNATDDTAALQAAIDSHRVLYFPQGRYIVTNTLHLKPDTVLIGLHPSLTQIILPDNTPGYGGIGSVKPLIEAAKGGANIVTGLGLFTGGVNPRASALYWTAGADSMVDDVKLQGGHGTQLADGTRFNPYNPGHTADVDPNKRWDAQYPSLWVTNGGGGAFANIWSPDTYAQAGFYVSDTQTPGHVYELSNEHHVRNEIVLDGVQNWEFLAPQSEEEAGESQDAVSLDIRNSHHILIANYHAYRVTRTFKGAPTAVTLWNSGDIRFRNLHVNAESGLGTCDANGCATYLRANKFPYEDTIEDKTRGLAMREHEFAVLDVPEGPVAPPPAPAPSTLAPGAKVEKLAGDFYGISGAATDAQGKLYFVDHRQQRIYSWTAKDGLGIVRDNPQDPVNLAVDKAGDLMVLSSDGAEGTVYALRPSDPSGQVTVIAPTPAADHPGAATLLPGNFWVNGEFKDRIDPATYTFPTLTDLFVQEAGRPKAREYVSPDGSLVLPAYRVFAQGPANALGFRFSDSLDAYGFAVASPGQRVFVSNGSENRTYSGVVGPGGALTDLKPFANRGGESVAVDGAGNVYVANGQVFVYAPDGHELGQIEAPERPIQLIFGGADHRTLFILAQHSLYSVHI